MSEEDALGKNLAETNQSGLILLLPPKAPYLQLLSAALNGLSNIVRINPAQEITQDSADYLRIDLSGEHTRNPEDIGALIHDLNSCYLPPHKI